MTKDHVLSICTGAAARDTQATIGAEPLQASWNVTGKNLTLVIGSSKFRIICTMQASAVHEDNL